MVRQVGDEFGILAQRLEKNEHDITNIYSKMMRAFVGSRIVAGQITGVIPPGVVIGPTIANFLNNSGGSLADGDVVVLDTTAGGRRIKTTTTAGDPLVIGVVRDVNSTGPFANGSETPVQLDGFVTTLNVTGSVASGDWLRTSTTVKLAAAVANGRAGVFARALSADVAGVVSAYVFGGDMTALAQIVTAKGDILAATAAGIVDNFPVSGVDGRVLTEDAAATFGVSWQDATAVVSLDDLTDVTLTSPANADRLRFDGSLWRNSSKVWMPLTTVTGGVPELVWDGDDSLIPTEVDT